MTELRYQLLPNRDPEAADVLVLPVPHELTVSYRAGTHNGPDALLAATAQLEYYDEDLAWSPFQHLGVSVLPTLEKTLWERPEDFHRRLGEATAALRRDSLLLCLGGEHSITPSLVAGRMPGPGTVVMLDAHADLRPSYEGSAYSHACPGHRLRAAGHRLLLVGVRSLMDAEAERIEADAGIDCYMARRLRQSAAWDALLAQLAALSGPVWLSIDMDVFDPGQAGSVGTPQPGGLGWYDVCELVEACLANPAVDLRGADIVELIPDPAQVTDMVAAKLSQRIIACWGRAQGYENGPRNGSQTEVDYH
ncbi:arginase family protein [Spiribacter halobius]|uniref:Agmatinase n=1 Tax=Sediminicurvatus halobius TaxID=2182432 RepID=A0A2U2N2L4_9GAMM|nr:arginase family protein [Spiribacter halobius]PWG63219.1 agmatinase [Spiribacter halobius]UEX76711.1 arginase family protein [Spiribacter halobius]